MEKASAESRNCRLLVIRQEVIVGAQFLEVSQAHQQPVHVHQILVEVVEIRQQDIAPINELVERLDLTIFGVRNQPDIVLIQGVEQAGFVFRLRHACNPGEEFVDGQDVRHEHRLAGCQSEPALEECPGPSVREDKTHAVQRTALCKSPGYSFEKVQYPGFSSSLNMFFL